MHEKTGIAVQFLPIRPLNKDQLSEFTGIPYQDALREGQEKFFESQPSQGGYTQKLGNQCVATRIDQRFLDLIQQNGISMCHHNETTTWCGGCLHKSQGEITEYPTEKVETPKARVRKRRKKVNRKQGKLFK